MQRGAPQLVTSKCEGMQSRQTYTQRDALHARLTHVWKAARLEKKFSHESLLLSSTYSGACRGLEEASG